jgi:ASC-1-like (ASCH) protein
MKIEKKIWPKYFAEVLSGKKNFEVRLADWEISEGDILVLREWDLKKKEYTGRQIEKEISYILKTKDLKMFSESDVDKYG